MFEQHRRTLLALLSLLTLVAFAARSARADVPIDGEVCNTSQTPISVEFFHHNTIGDLVDPYTWLTVQACSCVPINTHTDLWHNPPVIKVKQLAFVEVEGEDHAEWKVCLEAGETRTSKAGFELPVKKAVKGYASSDVETSVSANGCTEASSSVQWRSTAPQIDEARSSYQVLANRQQHTAQKCNSWETAIFGGRGNCNGYEVLWWYDDGTACYAG